MCYSPHCITVLETQAVCTKIRRILDFTLCKALAKRWQHVNATYRNIVGRNMFSVCVWPPCCDVLRHVGCCWLKFENGKIWASNNQHVATHRNTVAKHTRCCTQQCCDMLRWHVAIIWPRLKTQVAEMDKHKIVQKMLQLLWENSKSTSGRNPQSILLWRKNNRLCSFQIHWLNRKK